MRQFGLICAILTICISSYSQLNMTLLGNLDYQQLHGSDLSDIWGYVDELGNEYALVGYNSGGLSIVDVTVPSNPQEVFFEPGPSSIWRDIKTWGDYAYVTTEGGNGLLIVDMTPLPGNTNLNTTLYEYTPGNFNQAHNLYIDEQGYCYIFGPDMGNGGALILDLNNDPMAPVQVGFYDDYYVHDGVVRGDTLYAAHISDGFFAIVDVSDKANPVTLGIQNTSSDFSHNAWFSDDGNYLFTTDEVGGAFIDAYDISDPTDITFLDKIQSNPGSMVIPHNTHFINDYLVTSYYRDGVTIHDVSNPANMIEVGNYDTSPLTGNGFNGCWGVYPWLPSGNIIASDIEGGLFIFGPTYTRGCYLEGKVTEQGTGTQLSNVDVEMLAVNIDTQTDLAGDYVTGHGVAGTYDVAFFKAFYERDTVFGVSLTNGMTTVLDHELVPLVPFSFSVLVLDLGTLDPVPNADVRLEHEDFSFEVTTDAQGLANIPAFYEGVYDVFAGKWGYETKCFDQELFDPQSNTFTIYIKPRLYDDFTFDNNWTVTGNAIDGTWERGEPQGTIFGPINSNPDEDVQNDCDDKAWVTGNGGGAAGNDDLDDGTTILSSPIFDLTGFSDPFINYSRWWFNAAGGGQADDTAYVQLSDGMDTINVDMLWWGYPNQFQWVDTMIRVMDHFPNPTANMQFIFHASDHGIPNLVEVGLDHWFVTEGQVGVPEIATANNSIKVFPNPFHNGLNVEYVLGNQLDINAQVVMYDLTGKQVYQKRIANTAGVHVIHKELPAGMYLVQIINGTEVTAPVKVSKL